MRWALVFQWGACTTSALQQPYCRINDFAVWVSSCQRVKPSLKPWCQHELCMFCSWKLGVHGYVAGVSFQRLSWLKKQLRRVGLLTVFSVGMFQVLSIFRHTCNYPPSHISAGICYAALLNECLLGVFGVCLFLWTISKIPHLFPLTIWIVRHILVIWRGERVLYGKIETC